MLREGKFQEHHTAAFRLKSRGKAVHMDIQQELKRGKDVLLTFFF